MMVYSADILDQQVQYCQQLMAELAGSQDEKIKKIMRHPRILEFLKKNPVIADQIANSSEERAFAIASILAIGQGPIVFRGSETLSNLSRLNEIIDNLVEINRFYYELGGIIGYHLTVLKLILAKESAQTPSSDTHYYFPSGVDISKETFKINQYTRWGLDQFANMAEIYPVGGAGDRLNLIDADSGMLLPAAILPFMGKTLLEGLIRDLQGKEYLFFKLYGRQITTPVALMTSEEKNNHAHLIDICKKKQWFGRGEESFRFFKQPLVPVITKEGNWSLCEPLKLTLKPGGHGVIWKLAKETGVFDWLTLNERKKVLVRQINNPIAGVDYGLLAFSGIGLHYDKTFGFASCERRLYSPEGVNIVTETKKGDDFEYCLTNIEYTEFEQRGIEEIPVSTGSPYSTFPSNTNILFGDISALNAALDAEPFPGKLINMKQFVPFIDEEGNSRYIEGGRLETTMQNIADQFTSTSKNRLTKEEYKKSLLSYLTTNRRTKTISTAKKSYLPGESLHDTPEQAFYDYLENSHDLLQNYCKVTIPEGQTTIEYLKDGPSAIFIYHPALGPIYPVIAQKLRGGKLGKNSEIQLEIAELDIEELVLDGSLLITAKEPLGKIENGKMLVYQDGNSCSLKNVSVRNRGIDRESKNIYWKNKIKRHEALEIVLGINSEFYAEGVEFEGDFRFDVPDNHRLEVTQDEEGKVVERLIGIASPSWYWEYSYDDESRIVLSKVQAK